MFPNHAKLAILFPNIYFKRAHLLIMKISKNKEIESLTLGNPLHVNKQGRKWEIVFKEEKEMCRYNHTNIYEALMF